MSATRMLVLGVVQSVGEVHGYLVRQELRSWRAETWANVKPGSIYHALKKAARDGLLTEVDTESGADGPERVRYRITEAGRDELRRLTESGLRTLNDSALLNSALAMLPVLGRDQALAALDKRISELDQMAHAVRTWIDNPIPEIPAHVTEQGALWLNTTEAELVWARGLRQRLHDGAYSMAGEAK